MIILPGGQWAGLKFALSESDKNTGHCIMPNIAIKPSITALIEGRDEIMECALKLIKR